MNSIKIHIPQHYLHFILALPFGLRTFNDLLNYAQNSLSIDLSNSIICWDNTFVQLYDLLPMNGLTQITLYFPLSSTEAQKSPIPQQEYKTKHHNENLLPWQELCLISVMNEPNKQCLIRKIICFSD